MYPDSVTAHPRRNYKACLDCGVAGTPGNGLSFRGLCPDCGLARHASAVRQMAEGRGPVFEEWQRSVVENAREVLRRYANSA